MRVSHQRIALVGAAFVAALLSLSAAWRIYWHRKRRAALFAGVWLGALAGVILFGALAATPALADGGNGGISATAAAGGTGGTGFTGNQGNTGISNGNDAGGGGGGGAGGGIGGTGGGDLCGAGGSGGSAGGTGGNGSSCGGGGGGGGGSNGNGAGAPTINNSNNFLTGGQGGTGGNGGVGFSNTAGGGGGGGAGGYGVVITGSGASSNTGSITGGQGGTGGNGANSSDFTAFSYGGNGGDGGVAVQFTASASGATFTNSGTITGGTGGWAGNNGGMDNGAGGYGSGGAAIVGSGLTIINSGTIAAGRSVTQTTANAITFTGGTNVLELQAGSNITGNVVAFSAADTLRLGGAANSSFDVSQIGPSAQYQGFGIFQKIGTSTWTLTGTNTAALPWAINAGTLVVNGTMVNSTMTANSGGALAGTGTVKNINVNTGGTFAPGSGAPGTSMTVSGNLQFQSGTNYRVQVNSTTASFANVTGTASLGGATVQAAFTGSGQPAKSYDILRASTGVSGTFAPAVQISNLPPGFTTSLSYTTTDVNLNVTAKLGGPQQATGLSSNHLSVAGAINDFFNDPPLPAAFLPLFSLTGANLTNALALLSGEAATGAQQPAFQLTNQFLNIMLDPFVDGRSNPVGGGAIGFAPEREELPDDIALAYSKILKAPPKPVAFEQRWSVWGAGYGGSNRTTGDAAVDGSHDLSASTAGGAAGLDYRLAPGTVVGFALAGGGTNWSLAQGIGGGKSDAFQAGVYGTTRSGPAYLAAALAFTNHWMSTDRFAFASDHLTASINAQSFGGRVEGGYRFATYYGGLTPYAAIQSQMFHTPGYIETDLTSGGFALGFNSRNATNTRSELGGRFDHLLLLNPEAALTLRTRVAWAHDSVSDPALTAGFQTLPGTSFVVNGATPAKNSALTSAGAELRLANGVALLAKFDGEFASHSSTYAGTGTVRYTW